MRILKHTVREATPPPHNKLQPVLVNASESCVGVEGADREGARARVRQGSVNHREHCVLETPPSPEADTVRSRQHCRKDHPNTSEDLCIKTLMEFRVSPSATRNEERSAGVKRSD